MALKMTRSMEREIYECRNRHQGFADQSFSAMIRELITLGLDRVGENGSG